MGGGGEGDKEGWDTEDDCKEGGTGEEQWKKGLDIKEGAQAGWGMVGDGTWEGGMGWSSTRKRAELG